MSITYILTAEKLTIKEEYETVFRKKKEKVTEHDLTSLTGIYILENIPTMQIAVISLCYGKKRVPIHLNSRADNRHLLIELNDLFPKLPLIKETAGIW